MFAACTSVGTYRGRGAVILDGNGDISDADKEGNAPRLALQQSFDPPHAPVGCCHLVDPSLEAMLPDIEGERTAKQLPDTIDQRAVESTEEESR